jgi:hypothetical protein
MFRTEYDSMALLASILFYGLIFSLAMILYLLATMVALSPRVWAYSDYPKSITGSVTPPTRREKMIGAIIGIPFIILVVLIPVYSTLVLESSYGGVIPLLEAFLNFYGITLIGSFAEFIVLDFLIVGTITPNFVVIPGTEHMRDKEYKEFRLYHFKGHLRSIVTLAIVSFIAAVMIVVF